MVKGLSRQSVYPMEAIKDDPLVAPTDYVAGDDSAGRTTNDSSSPDQDQHEDRDKVAEFYSAPTSEVRSLSPLHGSEERVAGKPTNIQPPDRSDTSRSTGSEVARDPDDDDPAGQSSDTVEGLSPAPSYPPPKTATGGGRRLTFADETGGMLAEVSYSNRTHYSKQTGPGALGGAGRACCVIS